MSTLKTNNIQHVDRSDPSIIINTDGSVNIAGTMTYEDVTSVDSVGIVTARGLSIFGNTTGLSVSGIATITKGTSGGAAANSDAALIIDNSSNTYVQFRTPDSVESGLLFGDDADNDAGAVVYDHSSNHLSFRVNASERFRITSAGVVGINTVGARGATVEIQDIGSTGPCLLLAGATDSEGDLAIPDGQDFNIGHWNNVDTFTERFHITSTGLIGIGTDNPTSGAAGARVNISFKDETTYDSTTNRANGLIVYNSASGGYSSLELAQRTTSGNTYGSAIINAVDPVNGNQYGADLTFQTRATGSGNYGERMRITSDGKISIGEDNPDGNYLLIRAATTVGTNKGHIMLTGDGATNGEGPQIVFSESGSGSNFAGAYVGHIRASTNSVGHLVFGTRATGGDANTVPTERLRITSDGDLGINVTSPSAKLDVVDDSDSGYIAEFRQGSTSNSAQILIDSPTNADSRPALMEFSRAGTLQWSIGQGYNSSGGAFHLATSSLSAGVTGVKASFLAGGGLTFNGDTAAANALDDYEEGTWTPDLHFGGHTTGISYSNREGSYTRIGRVVIINWNIELSSKGSATGDARIYQLPFAAANLFSATSVEANGTSAYWNNFDPDIYNMVFSAHSTGGTTFIAIRSQDEGGLHDALNNMTNTEFRDDSTFRGSLTYFA